MPRHPLQDWARTEVVGVHRIVRCPRCSWTGRVPRRNALGAASKLRRMLREHLEERHPERLET